MSTAVAAHVRPNWFASVMGTGIVANAAATLPFDLPAQTWVARGMWLLAAALLVSLLGATAAQWRAHPETARGHLDHPVMAHFYGAPAMALMTVGAGAVLIGRDVIGSPTAISLAMVLWTVGTTFGLWTTWAIPRRTLRRPTRYAGPASGGWLIPVVPAMVSAASGALLVPHLAAPLRPVMIGGCYVLFVIALVTSLPILALIVRRVLCGHVGPAAAPTLFIVLGPFGQSVTAAHILGAKAGGGLDAIGFAYGIPVLSLALVWLVIATTIMLRAVRGGVRFTLAWWSFTFPIGTLVTGASGLAAHSDARVLEGIAGVLFVLLCSAWLGVATLTVRRMSRARLPAAQTA